MRTDFFFPQVQIQGKVMELQGIVANRLANYGTGEQDTETKMNRRETSTS